MNILRSVYNTSPEFVKKAYRKVKSKVVPFPYIMGKEFAEKYNELMKSQWYSKEQLEELQLRKLEAIIKHAYENVPYYRRVFDERGLKPKDIQNFDDLKKLPILTKDQIQENPNQFLAENMEEYEPWAFETGGSTGKPLRFYNDKISDLMVSAFVWRYRTWAGYTPSDKQVVMRYKTDFPHCNESEAPSIQTGNVLYLSAFHLKESNLDDYVAKIRKFHPKTIWCFPSTLYVIARHMLTEKVPLVSSLKSITTSSETLFPYFREAIEKAFGAKIYDWYESNERVVSAGECPEGGLHINSEYGLIEVVDINGNPVQPGEAGIVVGTAFNKFAMPFIRYMLGDRVILSNTSCPCGRGLPVIESLEGRLDDLIVTKDGRFVGRLDEAFHDSFGIKMSQIIQKREGQITVKIVKGKNYSDEDVKKLDVQLRKRLGEDMEIKYQFVDEVQKVGRGKYRLVISELDIAKLYYD